ncbi:MAG: hypothetical protein K6U12_05445 [Armatimonadetes bacterium]|nr:hypothetical protein [Armatimonadota bacterium]
MRGELERSLAHTYGRLTLVSAVLMAVGWVWHLMRGDATNWLLNAGIGVLLLTPVLALLHLAWLVREQDRLSARYCILAVGLIGVAVGVGLALGLGR